MGRFPPPNTMQGTPGGLEGGSGDMMMGAQEVMDQENDPEPSVRCAPFYIYSTVFTHVCMHAYRVLR